jgi:hypothetical protein
LKPLKALLTLAEKYGNDADILAQGKLQDFSKPTATAARAN